MILPVTELRKSVPPHVAATPAKHASPVKAGDVSRNHLPFIGICPLLLDDL